MKLCGQAGLHVNDSSSNDATGWDLLIEFPDALLDGPSAAARLHDGAPQCRVQVKTSMGPKTLDDVTLSNLHRMATDPLPAFFYLVGINDAGTIVTTCLIHVDFALITAVLERFRYLDVGPPEARRPNKRRMRVKADADAVLAPEDAGGFADALLQHIGVFADYIKAKREHLENAGYENGRAMLTVTPRGGDGAPTFQDMMLGRVAGLHLERLSSTPIRFDLPDPEPEFVHEGGYLEMMGPAPRPAELIFRTSPLGPPIRSSAVVYQTHFGPDVDAEHHAMRVVGAFFEHEFNPRKPSAATVSFTLGGRMPLLELSKAVRWLRELAELRESPSVGLKFDGVADEITVTLTPPSAPALPADIVLAVERAVRIADRFGAQPDSDVLFDDLIAHRKDLGSLDQILSGDPQVFRVAFREGHAPPVVPNRSVVCAGLCPAPIGASLYVAVIVVIGEVCTGDDDCPTITSTEWHVARTLMLERGDIAWDDLEAEMNEAARPFAHAGPVCLLLDRPVADQPRANELSGGPGAP